MKNIFSLIIICILISLPAHAQKKNTAEKSEKIEKKLNATTKASILKSLLELKMFHKVDAPGTPELSNSYILSKRSIKAALRNRPEKEVTELLKGFDSAVTFMFKNKVIYISYWKAPEFAATFNKIEEETLKSKDKKKGVKAEYKSMVLGDNTKFTIGHKTITLKNKEFNTISFICTNGNYYIEGWLRNKYKTETKTIEYTDKDIKVLMVAIWKVLKTL